MLCQMCSCYLTSILILMITILRRIDSVGIVKLTVPEVVQSGTAGALLECHYSVGSTPPPEEGALTVQWLFNGRDVIYQWNPGTRPKTHPRLDGKIDLRLVGTENYVPLHLVNLVPELSGEYTCVVNANGFEDQKTKRMLVFSPEEELELKILQNRNGTEVKCYTRGVYPQPELTIELSGEAVARQQQRVWREGMLFEAETEAALPSCARAAGIACRLLLAPAGYTAIKRAKHATGGTYQSSGSSSSANFLITILLLRALTTTTMFAFE